MKKLAVFVLACTLAVVFTACGSQVSSSSSSTTEGEGASSSSSSSAPEKKDYPDTLDGLTQCLKDGGIILAEATPIEVDASFIGAKAGAKYQLKGANNSNLTVELYEYDTANRNEAAKTVLESAKSENAITVLGEKVPGAYVSDTEKYLMLFIDSNTKDEANIKNRDSAVSLFKAFQS